MQLFSVLGNSQKLDGGAMFGNAPRAVWSRWCPPDAENRIDLACRALLVREPSGRHVLFETGIGAFFEPKLKSRFGVVEDEHVLLASLAARGVRPEDVDVVVLSHLHFDHAGGALAPYAAGEAPTLVFPNATWITSAGAFGRARAPHVRDRASFVPELPGLLEGTGRLELLDDAAPRSRTLGEAYTFTISEGHTPGLLLGRVEGWSDGPVTFLGDLVPGAAWVHLPITMGYDRFPERLIDEKTALLARLEAERGFGFFTHDTAVAAARVAHDAKGKVVATDARAALDG